jgi:hypothetical protein
MERIAASPRGASVFGMATAVLTAIAIFVFGAPPWILVPAVWIGATMFAELSSRAGQRLGRR